MRLSELLDDVRADAPPARYDVAVAVRAGKRLRRRRRAGWAVAAATAAVVAIGVPQLVTRADPPPQPVTPAVTTPAPVPGGTSVAFQFAGYAAGAFRVADPVAWTLAGDTAAIREAASGKQVGSLQLFRPGVYPFSRSTPAAHMTDTARVDGRRAYFVESGGDRWLAWEYADGATAVVQPLTVRGLSDAQLRQVAEAFTPGTPAPVRLAFTAGYVTGDYTLAEVVADPAAGVRTAATFVPAVQVAFRK